MTLSPKETTARGLDSAPTRRRQHPIATLRASILAATNALVMRAAAGLLDRALIRGHRRRASDTDGSEAGGEQGRGEEGAQDAARVQLHGGDNGRPFLVTANGRPLSAIPRHAHGSRDT